MISSTDYVEAVQQISCIASRVCFFLTKIVLSGDQHNVTMRVDDVNNWNSRLQMLDAMIRLIYT